jgi:hypothetical protein
LRHFPNVQFAFLQRDELGIRGAEVLEYDALQLWRPAVVVVVAL